ncbi:hypothetical protein BDV11DRAFT_208208 [Aspergillus similis]
MDPLSCAASVLSVIQVAGAVANLCGDYIQQVKKAQKDINDLTGEINSLRSVLESLNDVLRGPGGGKLIALQKISDDAGKCELILGSLSHKINLEATQSSSRRRWWRHWKWPLQRTEVDEVISQLNRYTQLFMAALQIDHMESHNRSERKFDLGNLKIVEGAAYNSFENKHRECLPKTRTEILRGAGTGKSTISRTIGRQLDNKKLLAASFFFKRGEEGRNNSKWLFSTIARHMAITIPELGPEIQKAVEIDPYISDKVPAEQFNKLLLQPLLNIKLDRIVTLVVVIDALDECQSDDEDDDHDIKILLRLLPRVQESKCVRLRFFLTSRPELPICIGFKAVKDNLQNMDLHSIEASEIARDISIFLDDSFSKIRHNHGLPVEWPGREAINNVLARTVPLFISAATLCRFIGTTWDPQDRLQNILNDKSSYISEMARTYLPVLNQLLVDFLLDSTTRDTEESAKFWIDEEAMHQRLTDQCLAVMGKRLKKNICMLPDECFQRSKIKTDSINEYLPPELKYACRYWIQHLMQSLKTANAVEKTCSFLQVHFLHWIKVMSILGLMSEAIGAISRLESAIQDGKYHKQRDLVHDARRFILKNQHMVETAPLQLYTSGLIFSPGSSLTRRIFNDNLSGWSQLPKVEQSWSAEQQTLEGHSYLINSVTFSPDGKQLASGSGDDTVKLWDPNTGELRQTLEGHSASVWSVTFSPDGEQLASASSDKTIKLWDPTTGELQQTLEGHSASQLASGSYDNTIKLWDPTTGELQQTLEGHSHWVWSQACAGISIVNGQWLCYRNKRDISTSFSKQEIGLIGAANVTISLVIVAGSGDKCL